MIRKNINPNEISTSTFDFFNNWLLIASGDFESKNFNAMTISWGFQGIMWGKPVIQAVVRPNRYTYEFIEKTGEFTINAFGEEAKEILKVFGSKSGRDIDKINYEGLTPIPSTKISAPTYEQAEITFECKVLSYQDVNNANFINQDIEKWYEKDPYHRAYIAEIVAVTIK